MLTVISGTTQKPLSRVWTEYVPLQRTLIPRVRMVCRRHLYMMHFGEPSSPRFYMVHQRGLVCALPLVPDSTRSFAGVSATTTVLMTFQFPAIEDLFSDADDTLFERFVYYPAHVLHPIFPAKSEQPYLYDHKLINKARHGFLAKHSTVSQLECTNDWSLTLSMTNRRLVDCVYIDFKRAFDVCCLPQ